MSGGIQGWVRRREGIVTERRWWRDGSDRGLTAPSRAKGPEKFPVSGGGPDNRRRRAITGARISQAPPSTLFADGEPVDFMRCFSSDFNVAPLGDSRMLHSLNLLSAAVSQNI